jgi:WD40 repeat protein
VIILRGKSGLVESLAFSPDGADLAAPIRGELHVWRIAAPAAAPVKILPRHGVTRAAFLRGGRRLVVAGGQLLLHDLDRGETAAVEAVPSWVRAFDHSPDGARLVVSHGVGLLLLRLDDLARPAWEQAGFDSWTSQTATFFLTDDRFVVIASSWSGGWHATCALHDAATGAVVSTLALGGEASYHHVISADRRLIASQRATRVMVLRSRDLSAEPVLIKNDSRKEFTGLAFHPSGRFLAATSNDNTVKLYDTTTWEMAHAFDWQIGRLRSVAFSPDGMLAAAGGDKGKVVVWDFDL